MASVVHARRVVGRCSGCSPECCISCLVFDTCLGPSTSPPSVLACRRFSAHDGTHSFPKSGHGLRRIFGMVAASLQVGAGRWLHAGWQLGSRLHAGCGLGEKSVSSPLVNLCPLAFSNALCRSCASASAQTSSTPSRLPTWRSCRWALACTGCLHVRAEPSSRPACCHAPCLPLALLRNIHFILLACH